MIASKSALNILYPGERSIVFIINAITTQYFFLNSNYRIE